MGSDRAKWLETVALVGAALLLAFVVRTNLFTVIRVDGQSMRDTYHNGDLVLVTMPDLWLEGPRQGDVVILQYPGQRGLFVKRVAALESQVLFMREGQLFVDGEWCPNPPGAIEDEHMFGPVLVPEGCVFVLGDNRRNSSDSRALGAIPLPMLVGKVRGAIWTR